VFFKKLLSTNHTFGMLYSCITVVKLVLKQL